MGKKMSKDQDLEDYLANPEINQQVFIYAENPPSGPNQKMKEEGVFGSNFNSPTSYAFENCAPLVSQNIAVNSDSSDSTMDVDMGTTGGDTSWVTTITLNGYLFGNSASSILTEQSKLNSTLGSKKYYTIEINDSNGVLLKTYYSCRLVSINHEEGTYVNHSKYSIVFERRSGAYHEASSAYFESYDWNLSIANNEDLGYFNTAETAIITNGHVTGTETITVRGTQSSAKSAVQNAKDFASYMTLFDNNTAIVHLNGNNVFNSKKEGSQYRVCNTKTDTSTNVTTGEVTITNTFILVPTGNYSIRGLGSYSLDFQSSVDDPNVTVTIAGNIVGLKRGVSPTWNELSAQAQLVYNVFYSTFYTKANGFTTSTLNESSSSWNETRNYGAGTIDFSVEYNSRPDNEVANTTFEQIEVTDAGGTTVLNIVPVIGRDLGPILQDTGTVSERTKDLSLEVVYKRGHGTSAGPGTSTIITDYEPKNMKSVFKTADQTTWNEKERRYVRNISWVYEPYPT